MEIRCIEREEIDKLKWDSCVHYANDGNVFGYTWYLDQFNKEWMGLVEGDYESVFPLIWKTDRLGTRGLYQPELLLQTGLYSIHVSSTKRIDAFLQAIPKEFRFADIHLKVRIPPEDNLGFKTAYLDNHFLLLNQPYEGLEDAFDASIKDQIDQAEKISLRPVSDLKPERLAEFYKEHTRERKNIEFNFHAVQRLMWNALHRGIGFASGVEDADKKLLAVDFFIYSHGKVTSILPAVSKAGMEKGALTFLYSMMLRKNANSPLILDFNTKTEHPLALAFGAKTRRYLHLKRDKRLLKMF